MSRRISVPSRVYLPILATLLLFGLDASGVVRAAPAKSCVSRGVGLDSECLVNGVSLHFIDWGGHGGDLLLLSGLDDSARIYDELAPLLATRHHVIAVTRRGFGHSSIAPGNYDAASLAADVKEFLGAVGMRQVDLVGHSIAGLELTRIATSEPQLVHRLVYLDAATDKSALVGLVERDPLGNRDPPASALATYDALTVWTQQVLKSHSPAIETNLRQVYDEGPNGLRFRTPKDVEAAVIAGMFADHPNYSQIHVPALAIYSDYSRADQVPPATPTKRRFAGDAFSRAVYKPWQELEKARFRLQMGCGRTLDLHRTGHYLFIERPRETAGWINSFLGSGNPCAGTPRTKSPSEK